MGKNSTPIFDFLPTGRANAVPLRLIMRRFGLSNREARRQIELERGRGAAILSTVDGRGGYFRPATPSEAWRFAASQRSRAYAILKSARTADAAARALREAQRAQANSAASAHAWQSVEVHHNGKAAE